MELLGFISSSRFCNNLILVSWTFPEFSKSCLRLPNCLVRFPNCTKVEVGDPDYLITRCLVTNSYEMKPILKRFDYWVGTGSPLLHACRVKDALHHTLSKDSSSSSTSSCASSSSTSSSSSVYSKVVNLDLYSNQQMINTSKLLLN